VFALLLEFLLNFGSFGKRDRRIDGLQRWGMLKALGLFILAMLVGVSCLFWVAGHGTKGASSLWFALASSIAWSLLAGLWLIRLAPYLNDGPPLWLRKRWSVLDWALISGILVGALGAFFI